MLQECVLGPFLFNVFVSDLEGVTKGTLIRVAGDT